MKGAYKKTCPTCKSKFYTDNIEQQFCSPKCQQIYKELCGLSGGSHAGRPKWMAEKRARREEKEREDDFMSSKFMDSNGYVYYVSALLGENQYAICRKLANYKGIGIRKWRSPCNKICTTADDAQRLLKEQAIKRGLKSIYF